jgi:hypothetical protein
VGVAEAAAETKEALRDIINVMLEEFVRLLDTAREVDSAFSE